MSSGQKQATRFSFYVLSNFDISTLETNKFYSHIIIFKWLKWKLNKINVNYLYIVIYSKFVILVNMKTTNFNYTTKY